MSKIAMATEAVKETLVGTYDPAHVSVQTKARFIAHAVTDAETGELYLGPNEFTTAVAPKGEDFVSYSLPSKKTNCFSRSFSSYRLCVEFD